MKIFEKIKEKLQYFNKFNKKLRIIFLISILFVIVFIYFLFLNGGKEDTIAETETISLSNENYSTYVESKLRSILINLPSVKTVSVFVMTNGSEIANYLFENEEINSTTQSGQNSTQKNDIVMQKTGSSNYPVKISTTYPEITGVLICLNKIDVLTKNNIQKAVSTVLNIDLSCIYILQEG